MNPRHRVPWLALLLGALIFVVSPRPAAAYDKAAFVAPQAEALVVFIQNLREDRTMSYLVFDAERQCIAEVGGRQAEVVPMKPGKHTLYISGYRNHRVDVDACAVRRSIDIRRARSGDGIQHGGRRTLAASMTGRHGS